MDLATRRLLALVLGCVALMMLWGYLLKAQCIGHYNERRDTHLCSNDIQVLYLARGMAEHPFPYVNGELVDGQLVNGALEYPVLTGLFAWFPALLVDGDGSYLQLSALLLAPFGFLTAWLLLKLVRWRALLFALGPPLVWYSFHNWDLLVVAATVGAFYTWWQGRYAWTGVWLAAGASLKFWPVLFVLPLLLDRLTAQDRRGAGVSLAAFTWVTVLVNGFFVLASPRGWWSPYAFQSERAADITSNSIWYWGFPELSTHDLNLLVPLLLVLGLVAACTVGWVRGEGEGVFPFVQVCGALLALFMLTNKAHSPQYALWLLPFFCLVRLRWGWYAAYMVLDAVLYVGLFRWYAALADPARPDYGLAYEALVVGVWGRAAALALLFVIFLRSEPAFATRRADEPALVGTAS